MAKHDIDDKLVRKLAGLLEETGLSEIEYEAEGWRIRLAKPSSVTTHVAMPANAAVAANAMSAGGGGGGASATAHPGTIKSPMVGTVYVAAEPGAEPFVRVGDTVREGQTLFIVEAMKVMNPITAPRGGKVKQIFVSDGQPVEFDDPLIIVE